MSNPGPKAFESRAKTYPMTQRIPVIALLFFTFLSTGASQDVVISEFMARNVNTLADENGDYSDWIEIYNASSSTVDLAGWHLSDQSSWLDLWEFPDVPLRPGQFLLVFASGKNRRDPGSELHTNFKLDVNGEFLALTSPNSGVVSRFFPGYPRQYADYSYGADMSLNVRKLIDGTTSVRYYVPRSRSLQLVWNSARFDDSSWAEGQMPFGFDVKTPPTFASSVKTNVRSLMNGINPSIYLRIPFSWSEEEAKAPNVRLRLQYDDGIVLHVNGPVRLRRNATNVVRYDSSASRARPETEVTVFEDVLLGESAGIGAGENVLAVQVLNSARLDRDLFFSCELEVLEVASVTPNEQAYMLPTPHFPNGKGYQMVSREPDVSAQSGVYTDAFEVDVPTVEEGTEVRYSLDGSTPTESSLLFTEPVLIQGSAELRVRSFRPDHLPSPVSIRKYVLIAKNLQDFSSNLPILILGSFQNDVSESSFTPTFLRVLDTDQDGRARITDSSPHYDGESAIKHRGSASLGQRKKSLALEIRDQSGRDRDIRLLGMAPESDWVLYAPISPDSALIRNAFIFALSNQIGRYAVRTRFCELFLKDNLSPLDSPDYEGIYVLMEKVTIAPQRVDIAPLSPLHNREPEISGGYLLKNDRLDPGDKGLPAGGYLLQYVDPKESEVTPAQASWIKNHLDIFNDVLNGPDFANPVTGYARFIDTDSWIDHHLINMLAQNSDALRHSTFFYKDRGGKIVMGPIWDFDRSMGSYDPRDDNPLSLNGSGNAVDMLEMNWWKQLLGDPVFVRRYYQRWNLLRRGAFSTTNIHELIDSMADEIREAQTRNFERFPTTLRDGLWQSEIDHLKAWLAERASWLDTQFVEGGQIPGDANQNGRFNLGDALRLVRLLFPDGPAAKFPCEGLKPVVANERLLDLNGDGQLDTSDVLYGLHYLFLEGPPPIKGTTCIGIDGCTAICF